jgi:hypothetical protein
VRWRGASHEPPPIGGLGVGTSPAQVRLDTVGENLVDHFITRGHQGKAMIISIDKATAVKMYVGFPPNRGGLLIAD